RPHRVPTLIGGHFWGRRPPYGRDSPGSCAVPESSPTRVRSLRASSECSAAENCHATNTCRVRTETPMHPDLYQKKCCANYQPRRQDLEATLLASCRAQSLGRPEDPGKRVERSRSSVNQPLPIAAREFLQAASRPKPQAEK